MCRTPGGHDCLACLCRSLRKPMPKAAAIQLLVPFGIASSLWSLNVELLGKNYSPARRRAHTNLDGTDSVLTEHPNIVGLMLATNRNGKQPQERPVVIANW